MVAVQSFPAPEAPRGSNPLKYIVIGCLGVMLLGALMVGGCFFAIFKATAAPVEAGGKFLEAMNSGDMAKIKPLCDPSLPVEALLAETGVWGTGWTTSGRSINSNNGVTTAVVNVQLGGTDGKTRSVEMNLRSDGGWKVTGVKIDGKPFGAVAEAPTAEGALDVRNVQIRKKKIANGWEVEVEFEVHGLKSEPRGKNVRVAATQGVLLKGPKGQEVIRNDNFKTIDGEGNAAVATFTDTFTLTGQEVNGDWELNATVRDHIGGQTVVKTIGFKLP